METRIALVGVIIENREAAARLNDILHEYGSYIIGRMGIPYRERKVNILSVDVVSALSGKIGKLPGVSVKTVYSYVKSDI